ncbi:hypothetical protein BSK59_15935 [Paenibacillus odorifer]|nr:hypothetical protein BSK59_15935 [Paenibacillus odorifer]
MRGKKKKTKGRLKGMTVAEKAKGNVVNFKVLTDRSKMNKALNNQPIPFSKMSEKDRYETMQAMREED